jgi:hypothetical protein
MILNENPAGAHDDVHRALGRLVASGQLEGFAVIPHSARLADGVDERAIAEEILTTARSLEATAVIWSHTGSLRIDDGLLDRLHSLPSKPAMAYWDNDMYHWFCKPFPRAALRVARHCDVVFVCGDSAYVDGLHRRGCADIRYTPLPTDEVRFPMPAAVTASQRQYEHDVVLVGNRVRSRIPLKTMPGARERERLVALFTRRLGRRFAVYGHDWTGLSARGPIPFLEQGRAYRSARLVLGDNNLHAAYYFSNRLPIAMSSGCVVVHNWEPGLDTVFTEQPPFHLFRTREQAWQTVSRLLSLDDAELDEQRSVAHDLAVGGFTMYHVQEYMLRVLERRRQARDGHENADHVSNPWLGRERLR